MQTAGNLVSAVAELSACVKFCENNLNCRSSLCGVDACGDTTSVVGDTDCAVSKDFNLDVGAVSCEGFVNRVVNNFCDKVMESSCVR